MYVIKLSEITVVSNFEESNPLLRKGDTLNSKKKLTLGIVQYTN